MIYEPEHIHDKLYTRSDIDNQFVHEEEIISLNLREFFGGSLFTYILTVSDQNEKVIDTGPGHMLQITGKSERFMEQSTGIDEYRNTMTDASYTLFTHDSGAVERVFIYFVDENFVFRILDFTHHIDEVVTERYSLDLLNIIDLFIGKFSPDEIFCNGFREIKDQTIFVFP